MSNSDHFASVADQMLRLSTAAATPAERAGYIELSKAWRSLAEEAAAFEARSAAQIDSVVIPLDLKQPEPPAS